MKLMLFPRRGRSGRTRSALTHTHLPAVEGITCARAGGNGAPVTLCGLVDKRHVRNVRRAHVSCPSCQRIARHRPQLVNKLLAMLALLLVACASDVTFGAPGSPYATNDASATSGETTTTTASIGVQSTAASGGDSVGAAGAGGASVGGAGGACTPSPTCGEFIGYWCPNEEAWGWICDTKLQLHPNCYLDSVHPQAGAVWCCEGCP